MTRPRVAIARAGDGLHTVTKASLTGHIGAVGEETMARVCAAIAYALGC